MDTVLQQPIAIPPGSGKILRYLDVTHKLTQRKLGEPFIFVKQFLHLKAEVLYTSIIMKMK